MNLLYVWNHGYNSDSEKKGYLLNSKYNIQYDRSTKKLYIKQNDDYIEGFWGEHIFDALAVVGKNGAGKTRLANCIMDTLNQLETVWPTQADWYEPQFIIAFEDDIGGEQGIKIFVSGKMEYEIFVDTTIIYEVYPSSDFQEIEKFKFGYFNNVLDMTDYRNERFGVVFDASVGGSIKKTFKHDLEMHYIDANKDKILNYYENEILKMLDFIVSDLSNTKIPFVLPKYVEIAVADYKTNLRYISKELDKMSKRWNDVSFWDQNPKDILREVCQSVINMYPEEWISHFVVNLMLNLFKELCIPQTSAEHLENQAIDFLKVLYKIYDMHYNSVFEMISKLFDLLEDSTNTATIKLYRNLMLDIPKMPFLTGSDKKKFDNKRILKLPEDIDIVKLFLSHYKNTNFAYPYLSFNFGLSTGEFNFLRLFSKIAELTSRDANGDSYVKNNITREVRCENVFLYFDEVDLSLHPEWQRRYVDWLLQFIDTYFEKCTVQIIFATHSPIMLSDFPKNNVLYLWKEKDKDHVERSYAEKKDIKTFGNNIHTLFMDSFFLNNAGTMGAFAEKKINAIASDLKNNRNTENKNTLKIIDNIGDDIIRNKLLQMYNAKAPVKEKNGQEKPNEAVLDSTINIIKNQIRNLENTIDELEKMKSDKDRIER